MRLIGELTNENHAKIFSDYLTGQHMEHQLIEENGIVEVWVYSEDNVDRAETLFEAFLKNPDAPEFRIQSKTVSKEREQAIKEEKEDIPVVDARTTIFNRDVTAPRGGLTVFLVLICVAVAVYSKLGANIDVLRPLFITDVIKEGDGVRWVAGLSEIMKGEVWRPITPIFIHFGFMHLFFNMLWLLDLGSMVEDRKGTLFLAVFILVVGSAGNLLQYFFSHPLFGGMSGVLYGLIGYIWMKGKYDPASRLYLHPSTVTFMIVWYVLCLTGLMGNIANWAHTAGLVIGVVWGYLTSFSAGELKRKINKNQRL